VPFSAPQFVSGGWDNSLSKPRKDTDERKKKN
jgi:hypothetical protein